MNPPETRASIRSDDHDGDASSKRVHHPIRWWVASVGSVVVIGFTFILARKLAADPLVAKPAIVGQRAPAFALAGLDGGQVSSREFAGQIYIVNFWASWCVPCREEAPRLEAFAKKWRDRVTVIGIDWDDLPGPAKAFRDEFGIDYPLVVDNQGQTGISYGTTGVPETYVIGPDGTVMAGLIGAVGPTTLDEVLAKVMSGEQIGATNKDHRSGRGG